MGLKEYAEARAQSDQLMTEARNRTERAILWVNAVGAFFSVAMVLAILFLIIQA